MAFEYGMFVIHKISGMDTSNIYGSFIRLSITEISKILPTDCDNRRGNLPVSSKVEYIRQSSSTMSGYPDLTHKFKLSIYSTTRLRTQFSVWLPDPRTTLALSFGSSRLHNCESVLAMLKGYYIKSGLCSTPVN